ncbi:MAG: NusA-like transcription termination signal-binding factor [Desulfurococcales archaeon]|nr:NusA-like transcription termination signal-binding factor [Desulfurococcales archaeon]MCE4629822.1 NusA-like transcription termination signal-binding factor [Desulfurococcales archaeon]
MVEERITPEELRYLSILEELTGALGIRCIVDEDNNKLIFLVKDTDVGKAIGRGGKNVKLLRALLKKNIEIVPYGEDLDTMVKNLFPSVKILGIDVNERNGEKQVIVKVAEEDKGRAIGKEGRNIKRARLVLQKLYGVSSVVIK